MVGSIPPLRDMIEQFLGFSNSKSVEVVEIIMRAGQKIKPHYHKEIEELFYLVDGSATVMVDGKPFNLAKGDFLAIIPPERHQIIADDEGAHIIAIKTPALKKVDSSSESTSLPMNS